MFDQLFKKKHHAPGNPKGNSNDSENLEIPDADGSIDAIEAALEMADRVKEHESRMRESLLQANRNCGCGGSKR